MPEVPDQLAFENLDTRVDCVEGDIGRLEGKTEELEDAKGSLEIRIEELERIQGQLVDFLCSPWAPQYERAMKIFRGVDMGGM